MNRRVPPALLGGLLVAAYAGTASGAQPDGAQDSLPAANAAVALPDPARLPAGGHYRLSQSEERVLPDNSRIRFEWEHRLWLVDAPEGLIVEMTPVSHRCTGAPAICAGFEQLAAAQGGTRRFRVGFGGNVAAATASGGANGGASGAEAGAGSGDGTAPGATTTSQAASRIGVIVAQLNDGSAGPVGNAEVQNLLMFAGRSLPAVGTRMVDADQSVTVLSRDAHQAVIRIDARAAPDPRDGSVIVSTTEHSVDLATGLLMSSVARDVLTMADGASATPLLLRQRTTALTPETGPDGAAP